MKVAYGSCVEKAPNGVPQDYYFTLNNEERFSELKISSIDDLNKVLVDKAAFKEPQSIFEEVYIVEQKNNMFTIYEVNWKKILFEE